MILIQRNFQIYYQILNSYHINVAELTVDMETQRTAKHQQLRFAPLGQLLITSPRLHQILAKLIVVHRALECLQVEWEQQVVVVVETLAL